MAFHQPTRQAMQRAIRPAADEQENSGNKPTAPTQELHPDQSRTWVLFSPVSEDQTASDFSETLPSVQDAGRPYISDAGSLHTTARADALGGDDFSVEPSDIGQDQIEDDAELDSLDSHLPSFRSVPGFNTHSQHDGPNAVPVFPGHDGLGSFHLDNEASGPDAQNQIYQFEKFNPRRIRRRRESLDRIPLESEHENSGEAEKRHRIEAWRLEHSRVLLEEIQRETRRRRRSQTSLHHVQSLSTNLPGSQVSAEGSSEDLTWHDEDAVTDEEPESILSRLTQKVIKDLLGIDDHLLSILLGNNVADEDELSSTPRASRPNERALPTDVEDASWRDHLMRVVSRELGLLVNQLSQHPGAFSTFSQIQQMPLPYAGLPVIPEAGTTPTNRSSVHLVQSESAAGVADFKPTINSQTRPINIASRPADAPKAGDIKMEDTFTKEEWEQDLDIKLIFRYIRSRFSSRNSTAAPSSTVHSATLSTQDAAAKAARVRQHHPLISRARPTERRAFKATAPGSPAMTMRHQSSCASQSTRRSARRSSVSSRHYWDIGGSLGTGSVIASNGPMGSWGEV